MSKEKMSEKKMWICPVEKLVETPYMTEEDKVLVEKFNSDPKYKFWLVFYSAKTKEDILETMDAECYFSFLFNSKYELHKDLEYMFEELWLKARAFDFNKVLDFNKCENVNWDFTEDDINEFGNYYIKINKFGNYYIK